MQSIDVVNVEHWLMLSKEVVSNDEDGGVTLIDLKSYVL